MEERLKRQIGEQLEPGGRPKAPGRLELLQRFVNTHNHDFPAAWDRLGTAAKAQAWLHDKGLLERGDRIGEAEAESLRAVREALRALVLANHGGPPDASAVDLLRAAGASVRIALDENGRTALVPAGRGADAVTATLLGILHEAQLAGEWRRMKGCRQCGYAFFDRSRNRSAAWCDMSICGNRTKNRAYYRRRHPR